MQSTSACFRRRTNTPQQIFYENLSIITNTERKKKYKIYHTIKKTRETGTFLKY
ncbi:conserved hypothetical protein [Ktedonobacter racemifer DSM 44963]|uniref:Uncharacterized protein n=1 Tax=Ktedonobacter racemifer DSM 44963 TaxID=485913 RepID=D6U8L6_KTERA|nr:conserved hypothetical protein [Ktedonobacter racemifer DSM 44963]